MAKLQSDEAGLRGTRRILQEWIAEAGETLHKKRIADAHIHDSRKLIKKSRAGLRLLRDAIGEIAYRRENTALRDVARPLGVARDSKALLGALDDLVEHFSPATRSLQLDKFRTALRKEQTAARQSITVTLVNRQRKALREIGTRSESWRMRGDDWEILGSGLKRIYRGGRKKMAAAGRSRASEDLHDWRKQVKYLWHQLQILEPLWPDLLGELADQAHKLADCLGDDHDLVVLGQKISKHAGSFDSKDRDALMAVLERRRKQLQDKAFKLGARLFEEKPGRFIDRMGSYWRQWRAE